MADASPSWRLEGFLERFDLWAEQEQPSEDLRYIVTEWILTRAIDPYQGARREQGFDNLWFGRIPNSHDGDGHVVVCSYLVYESTRTVSCDLFASLSPPV